MTGALTNERPSGKARPVRPYLLAALALACAGALFILYAFYWPNAFQGPAEKAFYVSRGETFTQIVDSLEIQGVIRSRGLFTFVANLRGGIARLQVGKYIFPRGVSNAAVFLSLRTGRGVALIPVTLREGLTVRRQARILARALGIDSAKYLSLSLDTAFARSLGIHEETLEGCLLPDTYAFGWQPDERDVIRRITEEFRRFYGDSLQQRTSALGLSMREVLTVASLVEGETRLGDERSLVAGVYYNRLRRGMRLEADPTIQYIVEGRPRRLYYTDLGLDSPYNTYRHSGLPPGPVNNPGRSSILAALYPARHQYLFFVANGRGGHWFSSTYQDHLRNVRMARKLRRLAEAGGQNDPRK